MLFLNSALDWINFFASCKVDRWFILCLFIGIECMLYLCLNKYKTGMITDEMAVFFISKVSYI